ncbi:MAG: hypothetical protein K9N23_05295 [Akkermansiaceae bacterium]|nr:hypothetical protein [Akkermansiaceae bacterium]MCF7731078.1 hypothetical protein [Akkermansiaceae bacterium]
MSAIESQSLRQIGKRLEGFKTALAWFDKVLVAQGQIADEDKRLAAACEAFRKVLAKA